VRGNFWSFSSELKISSVSSIPLPLAESGERKNIQSQSTYATLTKMTDNTFDIKVTKQKVMVGKLLLLFPPPLPAYSSPDHDLP